MANIKQITLPNGTTYDIVDAGARQLIEDLGNALYWMGVTTTELVDGSTTNPITIGEESKTAEIGGMAQYDGEEFVWNGTAWQAIGKNNFGDFAFVDRGDVRGTAAAQTFTGTQATISSQATYTPAGTIELTSTEQDILVSVYPTLTTIKEFDDAGSVTAGTAAAFTQGVDTFTATVDANEVLTLSFSQGTDSFTANTPTAVTLPTSKDTAVIKEIEDIVDKTNVPSGAVFTGTQATINSEATYTPAGTNEASTITGTATPHTV